jgi:uncharacterized protein YraI
MRQALQRLSIFLTIIALFALIGYLIFRNVREGLAEPTAPANFPTAQVEASPTPFPSPTPSPDLSLTEVAATPTQTQTLPAESEAASDPEPETAPATDTNTTPSNPAQLIASQGNTNLRSGPGTDFERVSLLEANQSLPIVGRSADGEWWQVQTADGLAWAAASVTTAENADSVPVVDPTSQTESATVVPAEPRVIASQGRVNLRSGPGTEFERMGALEANQSLVIVGRSADGEWWQVAQLDGLAWIAASVTTAENTETVPVVSLGQAEADTDSADEAVSEEEAASDETTLDEEAASDSGSDDDEGEEAEATPSPEPIVTTTPTGEIGSGLALTPTTTLTDTDPLTETTPGTEPTATIREVSISMVNRGAEFVELENLVEYNIDLTGWILRSDNGGEICELEGQLTPRGTLRIWAMAQDQGEIGYNCGFPMPIWNTVDPDPATLLNAAGELVDRSE